MSAPPAAAIQSIGDSGVRQSNSDNGIIADIDHGEAGYESIQQTEPEGQRNLTAEDERRRNSILRRYRRRGANGTCALLLITILFVLSLYWAIDNWASAGGRRLTWSKTKCTINNKTAEAGPSFPGQERKWRSKLMVDFTAKKNTGSKPTPSLLRQKIAWRWETEIYNVTQDDALTYQSSLTVGEMYSCWVVHDADRNDQDSEGRHSEDGNEGWRASMSVATNLSRNGLDIALISTCTVAFLLVSFLIALLYAISAVDLLEDLDRPEPRPGTVQPNAFSEAQIKAICAAAANCAKRNDEAAGMFDGVPWDCAICLDDEGGEGGRLAQLTCRHVYHTKCVRGWLMRGGVTCPLCNHRLQPVGEEDSAKAKALEIEDGSDTPIIENEPSFDGLPLVPDIAIAIMNMYSAPEPAYRGPESSFSQPDSAPVGTLRQQSGRDQSECPDNMSDICVPNSTPTHQSAGTPSGTGASSPSSIAGEKFDFKTEKVDLEAAVNTSSSKDIGSLRADLVVWAAQPEGQCNKCSSGKTACECRCIATTGPPAAASDTIEESPAAVENNGLLSIGTGAGEDHGLDWSSGEHKGQSRNNSY